MLKILHFVKFICEMYILADIVREKIPKWLSNAGVHGNSLSEI